MKFIVYFYLLVLMTSCANAGESICLIPENFTGIVLIVFDQKDGVPEEIENGLHVYRIPLSGILRTQVKASYIAESRKFYYIDNSGKRVKIEFKFPKGWEDVDTAKSKNGIYCYNDEMGETAINKPNYKKFRTFLVGKLTQMDSLSNIQERFITKALQ